MTTEQRKEELRKQFFEFTTLVSGVTIHSEASANQIFNFFYSEIESRDKEIDALNDDVRGYRNGHELNSKRYIEALSKLQRLEEIIKAQNDVIEKAKKMDAFVVEALESYNKLKSKT